MIMFSRIFILYFMAMILMPCADIHAATSSIAEQIAISSDHEDCPHENENDFCSPFCICSCCGQTSLISQERNPIHKAIMVDSKDTEIYGTETNWASEYLDRLFHPPKI